MPQGGLDWETIAMVAAAASALVIGWDFVALRTGAGRSETRKGLLEVAWPVLFISVMGLLLKFTDFAAVLLLAAVITGLMIIGHGAPSRHGRRRTRPGAGSARRRRRRR